MNWTQIEGQWEQLKGKARSKWGKLTDDDVERCEGRREHLVGKLKERYGETKEWAEKQVDDFIDSL